MSTQHAKGVDKMQLYWYPTYRSVRNVWLIKEMGVEDDFQLILYNPHGDPSAREEYKKKVHPNGTVPALVIPGEPPLLESGAICLYLADKYGKLVPSNNDRRDYYDFILYASSTLDDLINVFYQQWDLKWGHSEERMQNMRDKWDSCLEYLTRRIEGRTFLCGEEFTAADCVLGYIIYYASVMKDGELLKKHPKIREYLGRLQQRPAYQAATADNK